MNIFVLTMKYKLEQELKLYILPLKLNKKIFYSYFEKIKIKKLNKLIIKYPLNK